MKFPVEKNKIYEMYVEDIGIHGEGIGKIDGYTVFVEGALPHEYIKVLIVKTKKQFGYGKLLEILQQSPKRITPKCHVADKCGGCQLQHIAYESQLDWKTKKVRDHLERIGGFSDVKMEKAIGMNMPWQYRNKVQLPVGGTVNDVKIGFYANRSHRIIDTDCCQLQHPVNQEIVAIIRDFLHTYHIPPYHEQTHTGLVRHILIRVGYHTGEIMVCVVVNGKTLPHADVLAEKLCQIEGMTSVVVNENQAKTNVILGKKNTVIWGQDCMHDTIGGISFAISPLSFYQVNPIQTNVLYETALQLADLHGTETVLDLYCGIGTISLFLAQKAKSVFGVEIVPEAIADAKKNAEANGIKNVEFVVGAAENVIPKLYETQKIQADVVVVDPPRKGCDVVLLDTILQIKPQKVVYVSCDSATLARDLQYLCKETYHLEQVFVVDMFPQTVHVETVVLLSKKEINQKHM